MTRRPSGGFWPALRAERQRWELAFGKALRLPALMVAVFIVQVITPSGLVFLAIVPRRLEGLDGILFAPLLHGGLSHLLANLGVLVVLMTILYADEDYDHGGTLRVIWQWGGLATWLMARQVPHLGASGLCFGLLTYVMVGGLVVRSARSIIAALVVTAQYGVVLYSAVPGDVGISWEAHLCGGLAGVWAAIEQHWDVSDKLKVGALATVSAALYAAHLSWVVLPEPPKQTIAARELVREVSSRDDADLQRHLGDGVWTLVEFRPAWSPRAVELGEEIEERLRAYGRLRLRTVIVDDPDDPLIHLHELRSLPELRLFAGREELTRDRSRILAAVERWTD